MRRSGEAAAITAIAAVLAVTGCAPSSPSAPASASTLPTAAPPSATASPDASGLAPSSSAAVGGLKVDRTLLDLLPADIDGVPLTPDDETAAAIDGLPEEVEAIAIGLYIQPGSSTADDLAIVNVVRLRPGAVDEAWFRSWRETYDEGACKVAGGVAPGGAETRIGEHDTHIGSCVGGVHTYHVRLVGPDRVLSITAAGERRFGERVIAGLTE